ncbi:hypothetical protein PVL29_010153 [Vitis rotundifolia]|uniref:Uncharacterized protein n=1 Tax=Vitis rotundifolia TaxID=103349 RepID=A0AA39DRN2_VITRO|nr:hypothetical protein PVL29_010153 [Vitis rotundifolia]
MDAVKERDDEVKGLSLIDVCSEDDSLISQSSENQQEHRIFEFPDAVDASKAEDSADIVDQRDQVSQLSESLEPERTQKIGKCNLRKSLAWDSAFFTSAGVLEPEELSSMIEGVDRDGKHSLPRIQEDDLRRSTDSISTMESDSLTLESLEADLFEDVRASIQKSRIRSNVTHSKNSKAGTGEMEGRTIHSSKKVDVASQKKPKAASGMQGSGKMIKQGPVRPQVTQPVASSRQSISSLPRPPKIISRANPISTASTKRASLGANSLRMEKDSAKSSIGRGAPGSKMTGLSESHGFVPRPTQSSKSSSKRSLPAAKTEPTTSSSSFDSSGSTPSDNIGKSSTNTMRRKFDSRTSNPPPSGSTLKTPTRTAVRNKTLSANSHISAYLMSTAKLSSSMSPASSVSEWSTESSSSTSTVNQRSSNSTASLGTSSPCKGVCEDRNASHTVGPENQVTGLLSQSVKKSTTGTGTLHHPASTKPSGLRMPSPKIGFFDGAKSMVRTPNGSMQSHSGVPSSLPKVGAGFCSPKGTSNKGKQGNFQTVRTVTPVGNIKPNTQKNSLSMKPSSPLPQQQPSKVSSASKSVRNCAGQSPEIQGNISPKANGESHSKAEEAGLGGVDRAKHDPVSGLISGKNGSQEDIKITPVKGDGPHSIYNSTTVELSTTMRVPFAVNNPFCNGDFPTGLTIEMVEKADTSPFLDSTLKENS